MLSVPSSLSFAPIFTGICLLLCLSVLPAGAQEALKSPEEEYYDFLVLQGLAERPALYLMKSAPVPEKWFSNRRKMLRASLSDGFLHQVLFVRGK